MRFDIRVHRQVAPYVNETRVPFVSVLAKGHTGPTGTAEHLRRNHRHFIQADVVNHFRYYFLQIPTTDFVNLMPGRNKLETRTRHYQPARAAVLISSGSSERCGERSLHRSTSPKFTSTIKFL